MGGGPRAGADHLANAGGVLQPSTAQGRETLGDKLLFLGRIGRGERVEKIIGRDGFACGGLQRYGWGGPRFHHIGGRDQIDAKSDGKAGLAIPRRCLKQDARHFAAIDQHIIGPF